MTRIVIDKATIKIGGIQDSNNKARASNRVVSVLVINSNKIHRKTRVNKDDLVFNKISSKEASRLRVVNEVNRVSNRADKTRDKTAVINKRISNKILRDVMARQTAATNKENRARKADRIMIGIATEGSNGFWSIPKIEKPLT